jgi:hypothetical protein
MQSAVGRRILHVVTASAPSIIFVMSVHILSLNLGDCREISCAFANSSRMHQQCSRR